MRLLDDSRQFSNVIDGLPEPPAFEPRPAHPFFGPLHSRAWFMFQRVHDLDHVNQVNAIKEGRGLPVLSPLSLRTSSPRRRGEGEGEGPSQERTDA